MYSTDVLFNIIKFQCLQEFFSLIALIKVAGRLWPRRLWPGLLWPGRLWPGRLWTGRLWPPFCDQDFCDPDFCDHTKTGRLWPRTKILKLPFIYFLYNVVINDYSWYDVFFPPSTNYIFKTLINHIANTIK